LGKVLTPFELNSVTGSSYTLKTLNLSPDQYEAVLSSYMSGIHTVFIIYAPLIGISFICSALVKDNGVAEKDRKVDPSQETSEVIRSDQSSSNEAREDIESKEGNTRKENHNGNNEEGLPVSSPEKTH
jgi:hypothetical protein